MKVLVAANPRLSDPYAKSCREGELVWLVDPCPDSLRDPENSECSCARTFSGLETDGLTEVAEVVDIPEVTREGFTDHFWHTHGDRVGCTCSLRERMPAELLSLASSWPVGTLLARRGRRLVVCDAARRE
ncbi:hypothetical protein BH09ACT4_BH09ACT4_15370 [soil metagenome]